MRKQRLNAHFGDENKSVEDVMQQLGCIQAQDTHQAPRVVASRCEEMTYTTFVKTIKEKKLIRTRPMRGTLHYVDPRYVRLFLETCASKTLPGFQKRREFLGISDYQAAQAIKLFQQHLQGGNILTRSQIKQLLLEHNCCDEGQWVYHLTCYAGTLGVICFGPPTDKEDTFVLLDERLPATQKYTKEESLTTIARIYYTGHGPATIDDLCRWTGLSKTEAKQGIKALDKELDKELKIIEHQGKIYYYIQHNIAENNCIGTRLLGGFDEYFLGYKDRSSVADIAHYDKMFSKNGIFTPLILRDGLVIGTRKREFKKGKIIFNLLPLPEYAIDKENIASEAKRYSQFRGYEDYEIVL